MPSENFDFSSKMFTLWFCMQELNQANFGDIFPSKKKENGIRQQIQKSMGRSEYILDRNYKVYQTFTSD